VWFVKIHVKKTPMSLESYACILKIAAVALAGGDPIEGMYACGHNFVTVV
jgi:hypothetical protein